MGDQVHSFNGKFQEILHISEKIQARDVLIDVINFKNF